MECIFSMLLLQIPVNSSNFNQHVALNIFINSCVCAEFVVIIQINKLVIIRIIAIYFESKLVHLLIFLHKIGDKLRALFSVEGLTD
ncbi:hypothetical protein VR7878_03630 [Vibrio ruber DSM 16370]|uniref:Uncharacterized protein n=1 Tax=Vibrio ruber (strain DSM 16370 / JCM 11486 / BCRC 17186 / CECT 7878 / LMG 23124 / VR1) TaxID=1123498 RepID=A0A1R4LTA5_VIBR1|nr:hypothetical protein VR7878_03630 [Vibrio ruber DSM 16370]